MRTVAIMLTASLLVGCGYKKDIEALTATVAERDATLSQRAQTIEGLEAEVVSLKDQISRLKADSAAKQAELEARIAALESDLSAEREKSARIMADRGALRAEIEATKQALADLEERKRQAEARVKQFKDLVSRFQSLIDAGTLTVKIVDGRMVVVLATDILFASGSADLSAGGKTALTQVAQILAPMTERRFQVEGHTDNVPINTSKYPNNWYLAAGRAIGVVEHLIASGMAPAQVSAASFGDTHPVVANDTKETRAGNRRIEIVVVPDLTDMPGYDELNKL